jgi:hypothetical protein
MKIIICSRHLKRIWRKSQRGMDYSWHVQHLLRLWPVCRHYEKLPSFINCRLSPASPNAGPSTLVLCFGPLSAGFSRAKSRAWRRRTWGSRVRRWFPQRFRWSRVQRGARIFWAVTMAVDTMGGVTMAADTMGVDTMDVAFSAWDIRAITRFTIPTITRITTGIISDTNGFRQAIKK